MPPDQVNTPVTVKSAQTDAVYSEGRDYEKITDPRLNFRFDRNSLSFVIPPNSRIKTGDKLHVSYYHGIAINRGQVSVCMSEIDLYDIWRKRAQLVYNSLHCNKFLLSMDEIRGSNNNAVQAFLCFEHFTIIFVNIDVVIITCTSTLCNSLGI